MGIETQHFLVNNRVDTLTASRRLRRLRALGLLEQKGKGSATYYTLGPDILSKDLCSGLAALDSSNLEGSPTDNGLSSGLAAQEISNLKGSPTDNDSPGE